MSETTAELQKAQSSILDSYVRSAPSHQNLIDIFDGEWASKFPPPFDHLKAGGVPLFQDHRLSWGVTRMGGIQGKNVLELGPLEGGHTYILEQSGASFVTAIEANTRALLKCLITKEILNLSRTRFLCGDFIPYLETSSQHYDAVIAAGILYHMKDPLTTLRLVAGCTDRVYIWTHHYDDKIIQDSWYLKQRFIKHTESKLGSGTVTLHRHDYNASLTEKTYCGGSDEYSVWLTRDGLVTALKEYGFTQIEFNFETPDHPHGPALSLVAMKDSPQK